LKFYKDKDNYIQNPKRPPKPKRSKYELDNEFNARMLEWNASLPYKKEVKTTGNVIT
jgi:hypothetical protein